MRHKSRLALELAAWLFFMVAMIFLWVSGAPEPPETPTQLHVVETR